MADIFALCRGVARTVREKKVKFNHCQRDLIAKTFSHFLDDLEDAFRKHHTKDDCLRMCAKALSELWRVMTYAEMLVAEWANEDWWKSAMSSSVSSLQMQIDSLLQDFVRCLDIAKIAIAETTGDQTFKLPIMDHSQFFASIVEEAHVSDAQALMQTLASSTKQGKTFFKRKTGSSNNGLSKYMIRKLVPSTPPYYVLDVRCIEMTDFALGRGSLGIVYDCKCFGSPAVAKCFDLPGQDSIKTLEEEVARYSQLRHVNLLEFIGYTVHEDQHMLIMERGKENLESYLTRNGAKAATPLPLLKALDILVQIGEGMKYLHEHDVINGDLKKQNIIINATEKSNSYEDNFWCVQVKLADYGLSKLKQAIRPSSTSTESGKMEKYGDVYSFAMVMYEILMGCTPFENILPNYILPKLLTGWRPELNPKSRCPRYLAAFMERCWATNPKERPLFPEICSMLSYCKGVILRHSFPSPLSCINEYDGEVLASRLGSRWCIHEGAKGNLPLEVYSYATFDSSAQFVLSVAEVMKAGRHFGNWASQACDLDKAFKLFKSVQHPEHPETLWRLGLCYELGMGVAKNERHAVALYEQARDLQFPSACVELGLCHVTWGNLDFAKQCWTEALEAGSPLLAIQELLQNLSAGMSGCTLDSERAYRAMADRLHELCKHDVGRLLVQGPDSCNAPLLKKIKRIQAKQLAVTKLTD